MVQYNFGKPYYEIYDEPDTDPEHTDWITHPEEVIDDDGENSSLNTVSDSEIETILEDAVWGRKQKLLSERMSQMINDLEVIVDFLG